MVEAHGRLQRVPVAARSIPVCAQPDSLTFLSRGHGWLAGISRIVYCWAGNRAGAPGSEASAASGPRGALSSAQLARRSPNFLSSRWGGVPLIRWLLIVPCALLIGCGESSPTEQVRETATKLADDARAGRWGDYCAGTTDPDTCQQAVVDSVSIGLNPSSLVPSKQVVDGMTVEVDGDRAIVNATAAEDAVYVRRGDRWLFVWITDE
jgi:hypothetical protein